MDSLNVFLFLQERQIINVIISKLFMYSLLKCLNSILNKTIFITSTKSQWEISAILVLQMRWEAFRVRTMKYELRHVVGH